MNYKSKFLIVLAILLGSLMLVSAASAASDISVSDMPGSDNQVTIGKSLNEITLNDSSVKSLNAIAVKEDKSLNAEYNTKINPSASYTKISYGVYNTTITVELPYASKSLISKLYPTGTVTITIGDKPYTQNVIKGKNLNPSTATFKFSGLEPGVTTLTIDYSGDSNFNPIYGKSYTLPSLENPDVNVSGLESTYYPDETLSIRASLDKDVSDKDKVLFRIDNGGWISKSIEYEYFIIKIGAYADFSSELAGLSVGLHNITVRYEGDDSYQGYEKTFDFNVTLRNPNMVVSDIPDAIVLGSNLTVNVTLDSKATGTVTFIFDGNKDEYKCSVNQGKASYTFDSGLLTKGIHNITVFYSGDGVYSNATSAMKTFTVTAQASTTNITIDKEDIVYGDSVKVTATVTDGATGNVSLLIDNVVIDTKNITGNTCVFDDLKFDAGKYNITVRYNGNDEYASSESEKKYLTVNQTEINDITINVTPIQINPDGTVTVTATVLFNGEKVNGILGNVSVLVDGKVKATKDLDGSNSAVFNLTGLDIGGKVIEYNNLGRYNISVKFNGNKNYKSEESEKVTVSILYDTTLDIEVEPVNITVGNNATVTVEISDNSPILYLVLPSGTISYSLNNETWFNKTISSLSRKVTFQIGDELAEGNYTLYVKYNGDDSFATSNNTATFSVSRKSLDLTMNVSDIISGEDLVVKATTDSGFTGNLTFDVNGTVQSIAVVNGKANATFTGLGIGDYLVTVKYDGDNLYAPANLNQTVSVKKWSIGEINATLNTTEIREIDSVKVTATLSQSVTGDISVLVDGNVVNTTNIPAGATTVDFTLSNLVVGNHNITVRYNGNENYTSKESDKVSITVNPGPVKPDMDISIVDTLNILPIVYGDTVTINVKMDKNNVPVLGNVRFSLDNGTTWSEYVALKNSSSGFISKKYFGEAEYKFTGLVEGDHTVLVEYEGSYDYLPTNGTKNFQTIKIDSSITISIVSIDTKPLDKDIPVGNDAYALIYVNPLGLPTGNVSYSFDNETWNESAISSLGIWLPLKDLKVGNYTLYVKYAGDSKYGACNASVDFNIIKRDAVWVITVNPLGIEGILNRTLEYGDIPVVTVIDADPQLLISTVTSPTGTIRFSLDGKKWYSEDIGDIEGIPTASHIFALLSLKQLVLDAGNYTVYIEYSGDDNYNGFNTTKDFTINKANPSLSVAMLPESVIPTESALFTAIINGKDLTQIKNPKGNVSFKLDDGDWIDVKITSLLVNSYAAHTFKNLAEGNHTVTVRYNGDTNYNVVYANKTFEVVRLTPILKIDVDDVIIGPNVYVKAILDDSELLYEPSGNVSFKVDDGEWITVPLTKKLLSDPYAAYTFEGLNVSMHTLFVRYNGDVHFAPVEGNKTFKVTKEIPTLDIDVDNIIYGEDAEVTVTLRDDYLPKDPTGNVSFSLNYGEWITVPLTKKLFNPYATYTFKDLGAGDYIVYVKYNGDDYFFEIGKSANFTVYKAKPNVTVEASSVDYHDNVTVVATVPSDATGNVTFILNNGVNKTVIVENGKAIAIFEGLGAGKYNVTAIYSGDDNYFNGTASNSFEVFKIHPDISAVVDNIDYRENATVVATVPSDATGNIFVSVDGGKTWYNSTINQGEATIVIPGLIAGNYTAFVGFPGDDNYFRVHCEENFTVNKISPDPSGIEANATVYGNNATVVVSLPDDATGEVTIDIGNGITKTVIVENVKAIAVFEGLGANNYDVEAYYTGDNNYYNSTFVTTLLVEQAIPDVNASVKNITYGDDETLIVAVPVDATGNVTININGNIYEEEIVDGTATFVLKGLKAGNYVVNITYNGDQNYTSKDINVTFNVAKANPTIYVDVGPNKPFMTEIVEGDDVIVIVTLPNDATGVVGFSIDGGKTWVYADVINGTAVYVFKGLKAGKYNLLVKYFGDENYNPVETNTTFIVEEPAPKHESLTTMPNTGNPLLVLLITLVGLCIGSLRRKS